MDPVWGDKLLIARSYGYPMARYLVNSAAITAFTTSLGLAISPAFVVALAIGASATLAVRLPKLGLAGLLVIWLTFPLHVAIVSTAFLGLGTFQGAAKNMKDSLFDIRVREVGGKDKQGDARAFVTASNILAAAILTVILGFISFGQLPYSIPSPFSSFKGLPGIWPFVVFFFTVVVPSTALGVWVARRLGALTKPKPESKPN
jgi:hypothetical protein